MKLIMAIVKPFKLDDVREALVGAGDQGNGRGSGEQAMDRHQVLELNSNSPQKCAGIARVRGVYASQSLDFHVTGP